MKQITLSQLSSRGAVCPGRLFATWGLYGVAMSILWRMAGSDPSAQAATWIVAAIAAVALLLATEAWR